MRKELCFRVTQSHVCSVCDFGQGCWPFSLYFIICKMGVILSIWQSCRDEIRDSQEVRAWHQVAAQ